MFEQALEDKFKKIFEIQRVRYDSPGVTTDQDNPGTNEQETLFVEITLSDNRIRDGVAHAKVTGKGHMTAQNDKMPFGYFSKCIAKHSADTGDLFFYDFEENTRLHHNLIVRSFSFVYFFTSQYDPAIGTINQVDIEVNT